jgi:hypothetical protein
MEVKMALSDLPQPGYAAYRDMAELPDDHAVNFIMYARHTAHGVDCWLGRLTDRDHAPDGWRWPNVPRD